MNPLLNAKEPMSILEMRLFWLALDDVRTQITVRGESCRDGFDALRLLPGQVKRIFANGSYLERLAPACDSLQSWTIDWQDEDGDAVIYKVFGSSSISRKMALSSSSAQVCGHSCSISTVSGPALRQAHYSSCSSFLRLMQSDCWYGCSSIGGPIKWSECLAPSMWRICESFSM